MMGKQHSCYFTKAGTLAMLLLLLLVPLILPNSTLAQQADDSVQASIQADDDTQQTENLLPVRVGFYENPPKLYTDSDGNVAGFWPDLIHFIAAEEGWQIEWVPGTWEEGLERLKQNQIDIMPDVAWSEPRSQIYVFSTQKVLVSWSRLYARPGVHIETALDLEGKIIAGLAGSINYDGPEGIKDIAAQFDVQATFVDMHDYTEVFQALQDEVVDAGVTNKDFGNQNQSKYNVERTPFIFQPAHIEFAFPQDGELTAVLLPRIDDHIQALKANDNSIYYQALEKHLEQKAAETFVEIIPPWVKDLFWVGGGLILFLLMVNMTSRAQVRRRTFELRKSEENYRTLFEYATDGIFIADQTGRYLEANRRACAMLGYKRAELLNMQITDLVAPEDLAAAPLRMEDLLAGKMIIVERRLLCKDGTRLPVEISGRLMPDGTLQGIVRDITERKRATQILEENQKILSRASKIASMGSWTSSFITNELKWSKELYDIVGLDPNTFQPTHMNWNSHVHPDDRNYVQQRLKKALAGDEQYDVDFRFIRPDGEERFARAILEVTFDDDGNPVSSLGVLQDITERKLVQAERERLAAQIRKQAWQLKLILDTVPIGVLLLDAEAQILQANATAEKDLPLLTEVAVGETLTHLGNQTLTELLTSPPIKGVWHEIKAGKRTFEVIAHPVETGSEPGQWVLVINDVTQEQEIQTQLWQQERLAAVGQLAAGIAHDFNNIMATIILFSQMLIRSNGLLPQERERITTINQQAWYASQLITQILDFSRQSVLHLHPLDLLPLLKEQIKLLKRTLPEHIEVDLACKPGVYTVNADPTRMQQILTNLAVNARDAMPDGGHLRIQMKQIAVESGGLYALPEVKPGKWIKLDIEDTGAGIPPGVLPYVFEPFFTTKGPGEGNGLGLAQVYGIVGQHGGHINVTSQPGQGAVFTIYLPALEALPVEPAPPNEASFPQGQGELVLVVEDDVTLRATLVTVLQEWNYQTLQAANGRKALTLMDKQGEHISLIVSDMIMPKMGGRALLYALREKGWKTPVIMLTGHPMDENLDELQAQGVSAWLTKPLSLERLAYTLASALHE